MNKKMSLNESFFFLKSLAHFMKCHLSFVEIIKIEPKFTVRDKIMYDPKRSKASQNDKKYSLFEETFHL